MSKRNTIFGVAVAMALIASGPLTGGHVEAAPLGGAADIAGAVDGLELGENVQFVSGTEALLVRRRVAGSRLVLLRVPQAPGLWLGRG
jgi:hypothetical protein